MAEDQRLDRLLGAALAPSGGRDASGAEPCPGGEVLASYLEGGLGREAREKLEQHLAACPVCRLTLAAAREAREAPEPPAPPDWLAGARSGLAAAFGSREGGVSAPSPRPRQGWRRWLSWPRLLPVGAALVTAGLTLVVLHSFPLGTRRQSPPAPRHNTLLLERVPTSPKALPRPGRAAPAPRVRRRGPSPPRAAMPGREEGLALAPPRAKVARPRPGAGLDLVSVQAPPGHDSRLLATRIRRRLPVLAACRAKAAASGGGKRVIRLVIDKGGRARLAPGQAPGALARCLLEHWSGLELPRPDRELVLVLTFRLP